MKIQIADIKVSGLNPRQIEKDDPEVAVLAESIKANGQQIDIIVNHGKGDKGYVLIDGERRLRACKSIGLTEIEAVVKEGLTEAEMQKINALASLHRKNLTPIEKSFAAQKLIAEFGEQNEEMAAAVMGLTKLELKLLANLQKLSSRWQKALKSGGGFSLISTKHLGLIARLPTNVQESRFQDVCNELFENDSKIIPLKKFEEWLNGETRVIGTFLFDTAACLKCSKTSLSQVSLFPEATTKEDRCLDRECFERKMEAFLIKAVKDAKAEYSGDLVVVGHIQYQSPLAEASKGLKNPYDDSEMKSGEQGKDGSFPVLYLKGPDAGKIVWRKAKGKAKAEGAMTEKQREEIRENAKERKVLIEKGKVLIASITDFWKANKETVKKTLTKEVVLSQRILLAFGTPDNDTEANGRKWETRVHAKDLEKIPEALAAKAAGIIEKRLQFYGRPGDIPFKNFYAEAEAVAHLVKVDFPSIYKAHGEQPEPKAEEKKDEKAK